MHDTIDPIKSTVPIDASPPWARHGNVPFKKIEQCAFTSAFKRSGFQGLPESCMEAFARGPSVWGATTASFTSGRSGPPGSTVQEPWLHRSASAAFGDFAPYVHGVCTNQAGCRVVVHLFPLLVIRQTPSAPLPPLMLPQLGLRHGKVHFTSNYHTTTYQRVFASPLAHTVLPMRALETLQLCSISVHQPGGLWRKSRALMPQGWLRMEGDLRQLGGVCPSWFRGRDSSFPLQPFMSWWCVAEVLASIQPAMGGSPPRLILKLSRLPVAVMPL